MHSNVRFRQSYLHERLLLTVLQRFFFHGRSIFPNGRIWDTWWICQFFLTYWWIFSVERWESGGLSQDKIFLWHRLCFYNSHINIYLILSTHRRWKTFPILHQWNWIFGIPINRIGFLQCLNRNSVT